MENKQRSGRRAPSPSLSSCLFLAFLARACACRASSLVCNRCFGIARVPKGDEGRARAPFFGFGSKFRAAAAASSSPCSFRFSLLIACVRTHRRVSPCAIPLGIRGSCARTQGATSQKDERGGALAVVGAAGDASGRAHLARPRLNCAVCLLRFSIPSRSPPLPFLSCAQLSRAPTFCPGSTADHVATQPAGRIPRAHERQRKQKEKRLLSPGNEISLPVPRAAVAVTWLWPCGVIRLPTPPLRAGGALIGASLGPLFETRRRAGASLLSRQRLSRLLSLALFPLFRPARACDPLTRRPQGGAR